jgi:ribonuclease T1
VDARGGALVHSVRARAEGSAAAHPEVGEIAWTNLPLEARDTIALIRKGGPYPYAKDGAVFGNREALLPEAESRLLS